MRATILGACGLVSDGSFENVVQIRGDIGESDSVQWVLDEHGITNVIHLAALQVPFSARTRRWGRRSTWSAR